MFMRKTLVILLLAGATFLSGCGDSENFVFTNTNPPSPGPVAVDDNYTNDEDTQLVVNASNGVLDNDIPKGASITAFDATSSENGTVVINPDGSFTYSPAAGFTGMDIFTYTLTNDAGSASATVTITVQAVNGFFVDAVNGDDGTGSFQGGNPYATIQAAVADAPTNADIIVLPGNYTGTIMLKDGQRLLGSGSVLAQGTGVRPQLTGPVDLADGNTLDFLRIDGTSGEDAVDGDGQDGGTVTNCEIANVVGNGGVQLDGSSGTWNVSNNTFSNLDAIGILVQTTGSSIMTIIADNNDIANAQVAMGFVSGGTSDIAASVKGNTFTNSAGTGFAFELTCGDDSTFCLDLENNTNDDEYLISESDSTLSLLEIEQLSTLDQPQPGGAGNTGVVTILSGPFVEAPTEVADGACGF